jgi:hypothetical protein
MHIATLTLHCAQKGNSIRPETPKIGGYDLDEKTKNDVPKNPVLDADDNIGDALGPGIG